MLAELDQTGESQISLTDPDSRAMAAHTHVAVGYNVQIAVDAKHKLIVEQQVTNQVVDMGLLAQTAEPAKEVRRSGADRGRGRSGLLQDRGHRGLREGRDRPLRAAPTAWSLGQSGPVPKRRVPLPPNQRQLPVPSRSASSSLFVISDAWLEEGQLPQQPSLPRMPDPISVYRQSIPLRVSFRKVTSQENAAAQASRNSAENGACAWPRHHLTDRWKLATHCLPWISRFARSAYARLCVKSERFRYFLPPSSRASGVAMQGRSTRGRGRLWTTPISTTPSTGDRRRAMWR
jgi:hypothetical protein